jgi:hypothetical protein
MTRFVSGRRGWLVALGIVIVLRAAAPEVLRRVLVSRLSQQLQTRVEIGDVDLTLVRGGIALEDVAVWSPMPQAAGEPPLVAWKRLAVEVRYVPLLWKIVRLRHVALEAPRIALDRLADGELNLQRLVPPPAPPPPSGDEAPPPAPSAWKVGIDDFTLRAGGVRFRDLTLPDGEPLEIGIPDIAVADVALQPGVYGEAGRVGASVRSEGGALRLASRVSALDRGYAVDTRLKAYRLPLRRGRLYVPGVGWSELAGTLDAVVAHALSPDGRNRVRGLVRLRDVAVRVPDLPEAAFGLRRLALWVEPLDLAARQVHVPRIDVAGASVAVDLTGRAVLPLLARPAAAAAPATAESPAPRAPAPAAPPWHWTVGVVRVADSAVALVEEDGALRIGIDATLRRLADAGDPGRVDAGLAVGAGTIAVSGALRPLPPAFGGTVRIARLPLHDVVRAARAAARVPPGLLRAAELGAELSIDAGIPADGAPAGAGGPLRVAGSLALDGVDVAGPEADRFAVAWRHLAVPVVALEVPGALPGGPPAGGAPLRVTLGAVRLDEPVVRMTRTRDGVVLPALQAGGDAAPPPAAPPPPVSAPPPDVRIASFALTHGRVAFVDETVQPFFVGEIAPLDVEAQGIRLDGPVLERFRVSAATPGKGRLEVSGSFAPSGGHVRVNGRDVSLTPYNPYVAAFSPYSIGRGSTLSVQTDVTMGKGRYDSRTALALHRLAVKGAAGDTLFKQQFGIPLSMALALLRDLEGNIKLDVPVAVGESGTTVGLGTVLAGALRSAIVGAVTSPLKGLGAVLGQGGDAVAFEPPPIAARLGRPEPAPEGEQQIGKLAELLAGRPGVAVTLVGVVTPADARWLGEQDLRAELEARTGVVNALRGLPERNARRRIDAALAERAAGKPGELGDDDRARLDAWLAERPPVDPARLQALARDRAAAVASLLRERHGIPAARVAVGEAPAEPHEGAPSVLVDLGAAEG